ncbi:valine--tRNA ligase [Gangjinia marincola]|uniref:Valine--tRNA ligase n=1 Tax=Gangjinia marincola TaxID=578463 RepID=A0ABN1MJA9_9FLAO
MASAPLYNAKQVEKKWYDYWMKNDYFHSVPDERTPYTIVIPPPNVTGVLHMGHMLNNTIQDVLIRRARLKGFNACWVPGTDHASIATEAKVVAKLKEEGIDKNSLSREEFLAHAWEWKEKYGGVILEQLKRLGASCDWERTKFTMDEDMSQAVIKSFIDLYDKGLIYRGYRMVNWDPEAKTTLSDEEVNYEERQGNLYYLTYAIVDSEEALTIATTRPETIFGDTAICINPNDERFKYLKGKKAVVPIVEREVPIIFDEYVDMEFGTGCLKVTPAHDENDKILGDKHKLDVIDIFNDNASLNAEGLHYEGKDRFVVRKEIVEELAQKNSLLKTEAYSNKVGTSERTKAVIEPRLSDQWFLKMEDLAQPAIDAVLKNEEVKLFPKKFESTYRHWMENIRDWNISRQLVWGQQIPAYYYGSGKDDFVVAATAKEAASLASKKSGKKIIPQELIQETDVLDTWFSSWLWPMSVFDGIRDPENEEFNYYYPTNDLVTGPDILFFWVARMIIAGYEYTGKRPFENVYLTGLVRDKQRRKMSKSLGNSPDAIKLIDEFSADGVRVGLLLSSAAGNDLMFDEALCQQGKNFSNKIWNAYRLISGWEVDHTTDQPTYAKTGLAWYEAKFQKTLLEIEDHFSKYRISDALMATYRLVWDDFCSWLLEIIKPPYGEKIDSKTKQVAVSMLEKNLTILNPFMPFLTEELWHSISDRKKEEALIVSAWPQMTKTYDTTLLESFDQAVQVITAIRSIRKEKNISYKDSIELHVLNTDKNTASHDEVIRKLGGISAIYHTDSAVDGALSFRVKSTEYFIPVEGTIDVEAEIAKLNEELSYTQGFLQSVNKKLSNERFVNNAPEKVIAVEEKKKADAEAKIEAIEKSLASLT